MAVRPASTGSTPSRSGAWGIPVGLVAGDDALAAEVEGWLPWAERIVVKEGFGSNAAASLHPERAREAIRAGAARAVERARAGELRILEVDRPVVIEVEYRRGLEADYAAIVPGAERTGDRTVRHPGPDPLDGLPRVPRRGPPGLARRVGAMEARSFTDRRPFVALVIGAAIVLWLARDVIGPFVVAAVLAYAFAPLVARAQGRTGWPRIAIVGVAIRRRRGHPRDPGVRPRWPDRERADAPRRRPARTRSRRSSASWSAGTRS